MLFPKSEIHLQLLANTSHTDEKVLRARQEQTVLFSPQQAALQSTLQDKITHTLVLGLSHLSLLHNS